MAATNETSNGNEVVTFGCRLNAYESEIIKDKLSESGEENAIVFNTCAVTKEAERQVRQSIRKHQKQNPDKKIIVTGCAAQINPDSYASMEGVSRVIGNEEKLEKQYYGPEAGEAKISVNDIMQVKETAGHMINSFEGRTRAFIQVQKGCNHRCTFCTIPYGRGNSRSVPVAQIVDQVRGIIKAGYREIVLTGVDLTSYGPDLPGAPSFSQMIRRLIAQVPEMERLRLSSIDVAEIDEELMDMIMHEPKLMPHLHISLQAGDNMILKRMKRRHNREEVIEFCRKIRESAPYAGFGADIIAGFPTEKPDMFENTRKLISEAGLHYLHVFPYSERDGTPAARMPQVDKSLRKERARILREEGEKQFHAFMHRHIGKTVSVVNEKEDFGRAENFLPVKLSSKQALNSLLNVKLTHIEGDKLVGEVIDG
jgi:threonylcarbamoyladenosine tRNA methylthiotransferase MtaB